MLNRNKLRVIFGFLLLSAATSVSAEEFATMEKDTAGEYGKLLSDKFAKGEGLQAKLDPAPTDTLGMLMGTQGIILVPSKSLDDDDPGKEVESETGAPLAYLFMSARFNLLESGKPFDRKRLRVVKYGSKNELDATAFILTLRHVSGKDWQVNVFGADKKPLIEAQIFDADEEKSKALGIQATDVKDGKATLVISVLKKYEASFVISY